MGVWICIRPSNTAEFELRVLVFSEAMGTGSGSGGGGGGSSSSSSSSSSEVARTKLASSFLIFSFRKEA